MSVTADGVFDEFGDDDDRDLENASRLNVHTWSDHPESNAFVDAIYEAHFRGRKVEVKKRHLKVVLLDLYVTWSEDPDRSTKFSRNANDYASGSIYNELHISRLTIDVVDTLLEAGLVEQKKGYFIRQAGKAHLSRLSRIWPTEQLVQMFREAQFRPLDVGNHRDRVTVVLREKDPDEDAQRNVEYEPTDETKRMSEMLGRYNSLLSRTFIDIPTLEKAGIDIDEDGKRLTLVVSQRDKFVRRIFNRSSFELGGRFYGGWWQRCPSEWRTSIFMNDWPTNEVDFSGLHIILLYALEGIDYWATIGDDPYTIDLPEFARDLRDSRKLVKLLVLLALNADTEAKAFSAFRNKAPNGSAEKKLTNNELAAVLEAVKLRHPAIGKHFLNDMGIRLMRLDGQITHLILEHFLNKAVPVLPIHDSYIVPTGNEAELIEVMHWAFEKVMGRPLSKVEKAVKEAADRVEDLEAAMNGWMPYDGLHEQRKDEQKLIERRYPKPSPRYEYQHKAFKEWLEPERRKEE